MPRVPTRSSALRVPVLLLAVASSLATSSRSIEDTLWLGGGQVALHNGGDVPLAMTVDTTLADQPVDCDLMEDLPGLLPHVPLLGMGVSWTLEPRDVALLAPDEQLGHACRVARVEAEGLGSRTVFWRTDGIWGSYPSSAEDPAHIDGPVVSILASAPEPFRDGHDELVFPDDPDAVPRCERPPRPFGWSGPTGDMGVLKRHPDTECPEFGVLLPDGRVDVLTLCVPRPLVPFAPGDRLQVVSDDENLRVTAQTTGFELRIALGDLSPFGLGLALEPTAGCLVEGEEPAWADGVLDEAGVPVPEAGLALELPDREGLLIVSPPVHPLVVPPDGASAPFAAALLTRRL